ncbi:MAG: bifunctional methylenetetrahydrofolate dehydrogenase/methenyltetrahydrofolate cyclohydrolase FolD [Ignavibacteria bacterium]|nr:bifunctional methylenetetrahydrofolate dehydrogenase/methenyltetrahydrofolate cyclohydrolase FolD [Ignavibacteria bacterium]MBP6510251.1 bifunctional methylenetetrahydrofolate dehydrogenase/methenyltetrahydrofolate cyclohydrolase FolD [Candidatus Kapabacteria bacterium]MBK7186544.1 bifunctional methylenetetrahydrofolate dehydrogenase/methenyltetrahydrofolate cyclohydrolase FolD [Ignavibacteria bacterium]MBK7411178.1 bifunctional methylenetetrahydrofolate dehydrogenase/methenyltetrahydrofolate
MALIIDGNALAAEIRAEVAADVARLTASTGIVPGLNLLLVGEDPASTVYVRNKSKDCEKVGIHSTIVRMPATATEEEVVEQVRQWNNDPAVHGILVQLPIPKHINEHRVIRSIDPAKDVDGFHPENAGRLLIGLEGFIPCTPYGVLEMLKRYNIETSGKHAVVVGRSNIVGKPLAILLAQKRPQGNATVTICHTGTPDIAEHTRRADILISAVGVNGVITADHVKEGAVVIDVGINRITLPDGTTKLTGDVLFDEVAAKASAITPVPGGVGPMTRAMLLRNTVTAAERIGGR